MLANHRTNIKLRFLGQVVQSVVRLTLLHSEWPKLYRALAILSAKGLTKSLVKDTFSLSLTIYTKSVGLIFFCLKNRDAKAPYIFLGQCFCIYIVTVIHLKI